MRKIISSIGVVAGGSLLLVAAAVLVAIFTPRRTARRGTARPVASTLESLPPVAQARISGALGRDLPAYQVRQASARGGALEVDNEKNKLRADFTRFGVAVHRGQAVWRLALLGYGYGDHLIAANTIPPQPSGNRVEFQRGPLTEWYINGPLGLEQGFTLSQPPANDKGPGTKDQGPKNKNKGPLTISLTLSGNVHATVQRGTALTLSATDHPVLRYAGLTAYDADGKHLQVWLEAQGDQLLLRAADGAARYPVVIDPFVQLAELTATDESVSDALAYSVAISGNTVAVGAPGHNGQGSVYVFVEPPSGWANMTQTAELTAADGQSGDGLGHSVSISGGAIVAGAPFATVGQNSHQGTAYVFVEPPGGWTDMTQTAELTASDGAAFDELGSATGIASNTIVVGSPGTGPGSTTPGAAYVFVKPENGWINTTEKATLTSSDGQDGNDFGSSVAVTGNTAVVGAPLRDSVYVFVEPIGGWNNMTQTAELTSSSRRTVSLGASVSISGNTIVVGAPSTSLSHSSQGAAYIFVEPPGGWANTSDFTAQLTASDAQGHVYLGSSVAISGSSVLAGAYGWGAFEGAAYVFLKPAGGWTSMTQTARLNASGGGSAAQFGLSAGLNGKTAVVGASNSQVGGTAYVFGSSQ